LFKTIPVKKQGKYNLNVQLQDLGCNGRRWKEVWRRRIGIEISILLTDNKEYYITIFY